MVTVKVELVPAARCQVRVLGTLLTPSRLLPQGTAHLKVTAPAGKSLICSQLCFDSWWPTHSCPLGIQQPEPEPKNKGSDLGSEHSGRLCWWSSLPLRKEGPSSQGMSTPPSWPQLLHRTPTPTPGQLSWMWRAGCKTHRKLGRGATRKLCSRREIQIKHPLGPGPLWSSRRVCGMACGSAGLNGVSPAEDMSTS